MLTLKRKKPIEMKGGVSFDDDEMKIRGKHCMKRKYGDKKMIWTTKHNFYPVPCKVETDQFGIEGKRTLNQPALIFFELLRKQLKKEIPRLIWKMIISFYAQLRVCRVCKQVRSRFCQMSEVFTSGYSSTLLQDKGMELNKCCVYCKDNLKDFFWMDSRFRSVVERDESYHDAKNSFNPSGEFCRLRALKEKSESSQNSLYSSSRAPSPIQ